MTTTDPKLIERIARVICRGGGYGQCVGFCHVQRCPSAIDLYGQTAAAILPILAAAINEAVQNAGQWQDIATAPYNTPVRVKAGEMTFIARLLPDAAMSSDEQSCDRWQAEIEGEHPPCWSGGACWESNENEDPSLQPTHWQPLPSPPTIEAHKESGHG